MTSPRVALIGHGYIESASRKKLVHLSKAVDLLHIAPSTYPTPYGWCHIDFEQNPGVNIQAFPIHFLYFKRTSTRWVLATRDLGFSRFKPEIIHVECETHSWIMCQVLLYRRLYAPQARIVNFLWENMTLEEQGLRARSLELLARFNRRYVDFFLAGNAAGKQILIDKGIPENRIEVIPLQGIDADVFYPYSAERRLTCRSALGLSPQEFVVGFVGRFAEEKGLLDLVEAVGRLREWSDRPLVLALTGRGEHEPLLRRRCAELSLRLIVQPPRRYAQVPDVMNAIDVLVLPSRSRPFWKEQFGRVLIEAMACGIPVIGSDSGDIPNVIGDAGLVFPEGDVSTCFEYLRLCSQDSGFCERLSRRGLARVRQHYTNEKLAEATISVYHRVLGLSDTLYQPRAAQQQEIR